MRHGPTPSRMEHVGIGNAPYGSLNHTISSCHMGVAEYSDGFVHSKSLQCPQLQDTGFTTFARDHTKPLPAPA